MDFSPFIVALPVSIVLFSISMCNKIKKLTPNKAEINIDLQKKKISLRKLH